MLDNICHCQILLHASPKNKNVLLYSHNTVTLKNINNNLMSNQYRISHCPNIFYSCYRQNTICTTFIFGSYFSLKKKKGHIWEQFKYYTNEMRCCTALAKKIFIVIIYCFLCARQCVECFIHMNSLNPTTNS